MMHSRVSQILAAGALLAFSAAAAEAAMLTDSNGMTLYTYDSDTGGMSSCYGDCAAKWPPYLATGDETMGEGWTKVERTDGTMQWAYDGKPLYYYAQDMASGDMNGDGLGGVWHVVEQ